MQARQVSHFCSVERYLKYYISEYTHNITHLYDVTHV